MILYSTSKDAFRMKINSFLCYYCLKIMLLKPAFYLWLIMEIYGITLMQGKNYNFFFGLDILKTLYQQLIFFA